MIFTAETFKDIDTIFLVH